MSALEVVNGFFWRTVARNARRRRAILGVLLTGGGAASLAGCGFVAGPEYTGEVGLELRGRILSLDDEQEHLVPALGFLGEDALQIVDGEVTGEFPKQFVLRVDEAPREEALLSRNLDGSPFPPGTPEKLGIALLILVARDHSPVGAPSWQASPTTITRESTEPDPETGEFTRTDTECSTDGADCQTSVYACTMDECETLFERRAEKTREGSRAGSECVRGDCLLYADSCINNTCDLTVKHCVLTEDGSRATAEQVEQCTLVHRKGEVLHDSSRTQLFSRDLHVVFASEDGTWDGETVERGYNVFQAAREVDLDLRLAKLVCELEAEAAVLSDRGDDSEQALRQRTNELKEECPHVDFFERVANPDAEELEISIGSPPPSY
jgi:hypothetical protein